LEVAETQIGKELPFRLEGRGIWEF